MNLNYCEMQSPLGKIRIAAGDDKLVGLWFAGQKYDRQPYLSKPEFHWQHDDNHALLRQYMERLNRYFDCDHVSFDLPLRPHGTTFQRSVWRELQKIPAGQTITYGELAARLGKPSAVRAAAAAVGRNPISIIIPCHRVVGSNGSLTGYAGGVDRKRKLLQIESPGELMNHAA